MSNAFIALFDVATEGVTLARVLDVLAARSDVFAWFVKQYGRAFRPEAWALETLPGFGAGRRTLAGPGGFVISQHGHTLELWHGIRFSAFACDPEHREALRRVCLLVANLVGSERTIYVHECMPYPEAESLTSVEEALRNRIGPPAESFGELCAAEEFGPRSWYVDAFAEVRRL